MLPRRCSDDPLGNDLPDPPNVHFYLLSSLAHVASTGPGICQQPGNGHSHLASKVAALMGRHAMMAGALARRHPVVICDEHQDTSADQHRVVTAVHQKGAALRVFADTMQRIFGDRTAAAETGATGRH
jgi:hypothetical protein